MGIPRKVIDLGDLSPAERQVLAELDTGEDIVLGDGEVPETGDESRKVRAGLIRILLLGGDPKHQPHERVSGSSGPGSPTRSIWKGAGSRATSR